MTADKQSVPLDFKKMKRLREIGLSQDEATLEASFRWSQQWSDIECGRQVNITIKLLERVAAVVGVRAKKLLK